MNIRIIILFVGLLMSCSDNTSVFEVPSTDPDNGGLILPQGFGALVVADSVGPARHLAVNTNGDIYIKLRIDTGDKGNMALRDVDGDGKADIFKRFGDYPNDGRFATEMKIHNEYLYYSSELVVYRQKLDPNNLIPKGKPEVIMVDEYPIRWHNAKSLAFDNKGGMYVTFSAPTNACEDLRLTAGDPNAVVKGEFPCSQLNILGGVWRFDENKLEQRQSDGVRFATGLRSIVGITWNKEQDNLYAVNHGRDYLHNHAPDYYSKWENSVLPSEEFMLIKKDDDFGWPYTYYDHFKSKRMLAPEYGGDGKQEAKGYAEPIMGLPAHWAPNDLLFYTGSQFPDRYKDGAFIAFHGSTNRGPYPQAGYIVAFIPFKEGRPAGNLEVFADGFTRTDLVKQMKDSKYRPMGLAQGPDGSLYISESKNGKIWRVIFNGDKLNFDNQALKQMESLKQKSYLRIPDKELDLLPVK
ncbi:PQQ-dependent sugar dehydrogenase [Flavobacteriaceae bacterium]|nr:PQQ-dependent sugar dehydrogenase [Flavobacteriaceae bacterium]MDB2599183.1 PQQ-dependent sugar dehydrogenase [Flavobacteriaceae bacterium]